MTERVNNTEWENEVDEWLQQLQLIDRIISHKYENYKVVYDRLSIGIIAISSLITTMETVKLTLDINTPVANSTFQILTVVLTAVITLLTSVMRFKGYREKMESLNRAGEKLTNLMMRLDMDLKKMKHLNLNNEEVLRHKSEDMDFYQKTYKDIETLSNISEREMVTFSQEIYKNNIILDVIKKRAKKAKTLANDTTLSINEITSELTLGAKPRQDNIQNPDNGIGVIDVPSVGVIT
jgi:hypothetical protein